MKIPLPSGKLITASIHLTTAALASNAAETEQPPAVDAHIEQAADSSTEVFRTLADLQPCHAHDQIPLAREQEWNNATKRRFKALAIKEALEELDPEEERELEALTRLRRQREVKMSSDEVLWAIRHRRLANQLIDSLQKYAQFHVAYESAAGKARRETEG